jgi:hypothetical protein
MEEVKVQVDGLSPPFIEVHRLIAGMEGEEQQTA